LVNVIAKRNKTAAEFTIIIVRKAIDSDKSVVDGITIPSGAFAVVTDLRDITTMAHEAGHFIGGHDSKGGWVDEPDWHTDDIRLLMRGGRRGLEDPVRLRPEMQAVSLRLLTAPVPISTDLNELTCLFRREVVHAGKEDARVVDDGRRQNRPESRIVQLSTAASLPGALQRDKRPRKSPRPNRQRVHDRLRGKCSRNFQALASRGGNCIVPDPALNAHPIYDKWAGKIPCREFQHLVKGMKRVSRPLS
jgi:hypothetical protein